MNIQSQYFLRTGQSDLPSKFIKKGLEIVPYDSIKNTACKVDSLIDSRKEYLEGRLVLAQKGIYWVFEANQPYNNSNGDAEMYECHSVWIDPY